MNILCINTVSVGTQFALQKDGKATFVDAGFSKHSETLFPLLERFLTDNSTAFEDIDMFGVVVGPGSFTGIRIGLAVVKMFGFVSGAKCVPVNSLEVLAYNKFAENKRICAVMNAGAGKVFCQFFQCTKNGLTALEKPQMMKTSHFLAKLKTIGEVVIAFNDNSEKNAELDSVLFQSEPFSAVSLLACVTSNPDRAVGYGELTPLYLRDSQAEQFTVPDPDKISILPGCLGDTELLCQLEQDGESEYLPWSKSSIDASFKNAGFECYLAKLGEKTLGYIAAMNSGEEYEVLRLVVLKKARLQKIATKLLEFLIKTAQKNNISGIVLEVGDKNFAALSLYRKLDFTEVGMRKDYYGKGQNAVIMRRTI